MTKASSNDPSLAEVILMGVDRILADVHTSMPGVVQSYDPSTQSATIQPALMRRFDGAASAVELPLLKNVPVHFPATQTAWLRFPLAAGDRVILFFAERSLDAWWTKGGVVDPADTVKFSINDGFAIPGINNKAAAIVPKGAASSVELAYGTSWIEITQAGKFKITNGGVELLTVLDSILGHLIGLTTINCVVGSPVTLAPTVIVQLTADRANLDLLKA